jgi:hypothetical protein
MTGTDLWLSPLRKLAIVGAARLASGNLQSFSVSTTYCTFFVRFANLQPDRYALPIVLCDSIMSISTYVFPSFI